MFPPPLDLETVLGTVTDGAGNRPNRCAFARNIQRNLARLSSGRRGDLARGNRDAGHQSGGDDCAAQVGLEALPVNVAGFEAGNAGQVAAGQECRIRADHAAKRIFAARIDRQRQIAFGSCMVDQQFGFRQCGEGIAGLAQRDPQFDPAVFDPVGIKRIARLDRECGQQPLGILSRHPRQRAEIDPPHAVARPGQQIEPHTRFAGDVAGGLIAVFALAPATRQLTHHLARIIAIGAQHVFQQFGIGAGARTDLLHAVLVAVELAQGRKLAEAGNEFAAFGEGPFGSGEAQHKRIVDAHVRKLGQVAQHRGRDAGERFDFGIGFQRFGHVDRKIGKGRIERWLETGRRRRQEIGEFLR